MDKIKNTEVRYGNLFQDVETDRVVSFVSLDSEDIEHRCYIKFLGSNYKWDRGWPLIDIKPIYINKEWMDKTNLINSNPTKFNGGYVTKNNKYLIQLVQNGFIIMVEIDGYDKYQLLTVGEYVHELQNIMYCLTREEIL